MTIELAALRTELREHLGYGDENALADGSRVLKDTDADLLLNRSFWELLNKFPFREKEKSSTLVTVAGTEFYTLPVSFEAIRGVSIQDSTTLDWTPIDRMTEDVFERNRSASTDARGLPTGYFRQGEGILLQPVPDLVYTLRFHYWITLADLATGNIDPLIPAVWHEVILFGAVYRGLIRAKEYQGGNNVRAHQLTLLNSIVPTEAKEEFDSSRAGIELPTELTEY